MRKAILKTLISLSLVFCFTLSYNSYAAKESLEYSKKEVSYIEASGVRIMRPESLKVSGNIKIEGETREEKIKVIVVKGKKTTWYDVELNQGKFLKELWFVDGLGKYQVSVMINETGRRYNFGPTLEVENLKRVNKNLVATKDVESNDDRIIAIGQEIVEGAQRSREKAEKIYEWVAQNTKYDYDKYLKYMEQDFNNKDGAVNTLLTKKGLCYDYSTLFAALGRSQGLQVKVVKGYYLSDTSKQLHAWNQVYLPEEDKWIDLDTTLKSVFNKNLFDTAEMYEKYLKISEY